MMSGVVKTDTPGHEPPVVTGRSRLGLVLVVAAVALWLLVAVVVHLTQGTADVDAGMLWQVVTGGELPQAAAVLIDSRIPRLLAALMVGIALGASGAAMQSVSRNPLASPDTTGVGAGAYFALTVAAAFGLSAGPIGGLGIAFLGGVAAAAAVIGLASGGTLSPMRLVLAGSVLTLGLGSITSVVLLMFPWQTQGMFAWGAPGRAGSRRSRTTRRPRRPAGRRTPRWSRRTR